MEKEKDKVPAFSVKRQKEDTGGFLYERQFRNLKSDTNIVF
jgi:hypothetical protein